MDLPVLESWEEILEEFRERHHRLAVFVQQTSKHFVQPSMAGQMEPEDLDFLRGVTAERDDVEWHLKQAEVALAKGQELEAFLSDPPSYITTRNLCYIPDLFQMRKSGKIYRNGFQRWLRNISHSSPSARLKRSAMTTCVLGWRKGVTLRFCRAAVCPQKNLPRFPWTPRAKYRAVICGNFQKQTGEKEGQSYYAGGADSILIRTALRRDSFKVSVLLEWTSKRSFFRMQTGWQLHICLRYVRTRPSGAREEAFGMRVRSS